MKRKFLALAVGAVIAAPAAAQQVTFMTGPQGGSWIPLGGAQLPDAARDAALAREAVSFYQVASHLFRNGLYLD